MSKKEIYFSVDMEADGPSPGLNSMLSYAAVALKFTDGKPVFLDVFSSNLELLKGAKPDEKTTINFWNRFPKQYAETRNNIEHPGLSFLRFDNWIKNITENGEYEPIFVAYPAVYDFKWLDWYFFRYLGRNPFGFTALDLKSYANGVLKHKHFNSTNRHTMPTPDYPDHVKHTHIALDDALEQAYLFIKLRQENLENG